MTLGIAGQDPYADLGSMVHDVRVLATMRARSVPVFSLETAARAYGPAGVAAIARAERRPFTGSDARLETATSPQAEADREALVSLDAVAVASTPVITDDQPGGAQHANAYGDCGVP